MSIHKFGFGYTIRGIFPRHRNPSSKSYFDFIHLDVKDVSRQETVLGAMLLSDAVDGGDTEELLVYNDRWYIADKVKDPSAPGAGMIRSVANITGTGFNKIESLSQMAQCSVFDLQNNTNVNNKILIDGEVVLPDPSDFRIIEKNHCEERLAALTNRVENDDVICVDGELYTSVKPPMFVMQFDKHGFTRSEPKHAINLKVVFGNPLEDAPAFDYTPSPANQIVFSIDQGAEIDHHLRELEDHHEIALTTWSHAEYFFGPVVSANTEKKDFVKQVQECLYQTTGMRHWPREEIYAFLDYRDAAEMAKKEGYTDQALDTVSSFMRDYGYKKFDPYTRVVMDRWDLRPIDLDLTISDDTPENGPSL